MEKLITDKELLAIMKKERGEMPYREFAQKRLRKAVSGQFIYNVFTGERPITAKVAKAMGFEQVTLFRKVQPRAKPKAEKAA